MIVENIKLAGAKISKTTFSEIKHRQLFCNTLDGVDYLFIRIYDRGICLTADLLPRIFHWNDEVCLVGYNKFSWWTV